MRATTIARYLVFAFIGAAYAGEHTGSLCTADESILFSCRTGKKVISLCASPDLSATTGHLKYRFGTPGKAAELTYPDKFIPLAQAFNYSASGYAKGSTYEVEFSISAYTYTVHADRHVFRDNAAGVFVEKGKERVAYFKCNRSDPPHDLWKLQKIGIVVNEPRHIGTPDP